MMDNLFRKANVNVGGYIPPTLVNLSLRGNKVRKYNVRRRKNLIPEHKNELVIPYIRITDRNESGQYGEQVLLNTAIQKMSIFSDMKFRTKYEEILHIAQWLYAHKIMKQGSKKRARKIAQALGYEDVYKLDNYLEDKLDDDLSELSKNEKKFMSLYHSDLPLMHQSQFDDIVLEAIKDILADKPLTEVYQSYVKKIAFAVQPYHHDYEYYKDIIGTFLSMRYPVGHKLPDALIKADTVRIYNTIMAFFYGVVEAQSYIRWSRVKGAWYYDRDNDRYTHKKVSTTQIRRRVNKLVQMLTNPMTASNMGYRVRKYLNTEGGIVLEGEEYLAKLEEMDDMAMEEGGIQLPEGLTPELQQQIMEDSEEQYKRHFVNYWSGDTTGVHGVAKIFKFTPTNTIHKAVREIAKRNSDRGIVPKNMHRMTTDKKVFTNKTTVAGGSMMIDCSGSMALYEEDIREIIDYLPAANIAGYVGYHDKIDGYEGMIRLIAKDGRIDTSAFEALESYGANSVDLDGLKWLAEQPEPRIWISDQQVIGVNANGNATNLSLEKRQEISRYMKRHNIIPIRIVEHVKKLAKQLGT